MITGVVSFRIAGVSAFAFQGTNAHAVLLSAPKAALPRATPTASSMVWRRSRAWVAPPASIFVRGLAPASGAGKSAFEVQLFGSHAAFLRQHRVFGAAVAPSAVLLELAAATVAIAGAGTGDSAGDATCIALAGVVFASSLPLGEAVLPGVTVMLHHTSGALQVLSGADRSTQTHLHCNLASVPSITGASAGRAAAEASLTPLAQRAATVLAPLLARAVAATHASAGAAPAAEPVEDAGGMAIDPCRLESTLQLQALLQRAPDAPDAAAPPPPLMVPVTIGAVLLGRPGSSCLPPASRLAASSFACSEASAAAASRFALRYAPTGVPAPGEAPGPAADAPALVVSGVQFRQLSAGRLSTAGAAGAATSAIGAAAVPVAAAADEEATLTPVVLPPEELMALVQSTVRSILGEEVRTRLCFPLFDTVAGRIT